MEKINAGRVLSLYGFTRFDSEILRVLVTIGYRNIKCKKKKRNNKLLIFTLIISNQTLGLTPHALSFMAFLSNWVDIK